MNTCEAAGASRGFRQASAPQGVDFACGTDQRPRFDPAGACNLEQGFDLSAKLGIIRAMLFEELLAPLRRQIKCLRANSW